ncbi:uncharacterized protein LOC115024055 [Cottoperca gobio]|uniref:Uncharacterized protein LOC115024055 n=1 Tax=Cottoperca gobio TaxID=56716 RepID=A0A6J2RPS6_COTGO|nr:uncharacterized protein LOC115024055 [Cottoperca gobio]
MLGNPALYSRLLLVFVLVYAAVMSFITCSDAARASPTTTQVDNGVNRLNYLRRLYNPHRQQHSLFTGLPLTKTGLRTWTNGETDTSGKYREASSIIYHESKPLGFTEGFSYNHNSPDNREPRARTTRVRSGVRPANSYHPLSANSYNSNSALIRKSSHKKATSPFHQSSSPSQVWDAQKSHIKEKVPRYDSPSLPTSRGHGYKETNELAAAGVRRTSSGIQSSNVFGFAPHAPVSNSLDASVIKSMPSPEKLTSSVTDFSRGLHSVRSSATPRHKRVQSYLFVDSQTSLSGHETVHTATSNGPGAFSTSPHKQRASDAQVHSRFSSNVEQLQRKEPTKEVQQLSDNANPLYRNANAAQYGALTDGLTKYQHTNRISVHLAPGKDATVESFVPIPHADFKGSYAAGRTVKAPSIISSSGSTERTNSRRYSFDKGKDYEIKNVYPSLSPRYSFGQSKASTSATFERKPTDYPSPRTLRKTSPRAFTSGPPESDAAIDGNPNCRQFESYKKRYGLKGFATRPLEGAKTLVGEPDKSSRVQQGFKGFKPRSSQIWQPKSSHVFTMSQNELSSDLKPLLKTAGSNESAPRFTSDADKKKPKRYIFLGFQPVQNRIANAHKPNAALTSHIISSSYLRSAGKLEIESSPKSEPRTPNTIEPIAKKMSTSSTSSTLSGNRVKGNDSTLTNDTGQVSTVRLRKPPTITHDNILGRVLFSGVTATTQTPIKPADKDYFPNTTVTTKPEEVASDWTSNSEVFSRDSILFVGQ